MVIERSEGLTVARLLLSHSQTEGQDFELLQIAIGGKVLLLEPDPVAYFRRTTPALPVGLAYPMLINPRRGRMENPGKPGSWLARDRCRP